MVTPLMIMSQPQSWPVIIRTSDVRTILTRGTPRRDPISRASRYSTPPVISSGDGPVFHGGWSRSVPTTSTPGVRVLKPSGSSSGSVVVVVARPFAEEAGVVVVVVVVAAVELADEHAASD